MNIIAKESKPVVIQGNTIEKYGLKFPKAPWMDNAFIELQLYLRDDLRENSTMALSKWEHLRNAMRILIPHYKMHRWLDDFGEAFCERDLVAIHGAAGSTKSFCGAWIFVCDFLAAPELTFCCSITSPMEKHQERMMGNAMKIFSQLPARWRDFHYAQNGSIIYFKKDTKTLGIRVLDSNNFPLPSAGILAFSCPPGETLEKMKTKIGAHNERNRLFVDEPQNCSEMIIKLPSNLAATGTFKMAAVMNPSDWADSGGKLSYPLDGNTIKCSQRDVKKWDTKMRMGGKHGICLVFDGRDRAEVFKGIKGLDNPHYWEDSLANYGENSPELWSQAIGRMSPLGQANTLLDGLELDQLGIAGRRDPFASFDKGKFTSYVGIDLSSATDGADRCIAYRLDVGEAVWGGIVGIFSDPVQIEIDATQADRTGQASRKICDLLEKWKVEIRNVAIDTTGNQGSYIDTIERFFGSKGVYRVNYEGRASKKIIPGSRQTYQERYGKRSTEIAFIFQRLLKTKKLYSFDHNLCQQIISRKIVRDPKSGKTDIETKAEWRKRYGASPDHFDAACLAAIMLVERGIINFTQRVGVPNNKYHYLMRPKSNESIFLRKLKQNQLIFRR